jgi:hypothetical protein
MWGQPPPREGHNPRCCFIRQHSSGTPRPITVLAEVAQLPALLPGCAYFLGYTYCSNSCLPYSQVLKLFFQNENLVAYLDGECVASVPDLICCIETESKEEGTCMLPPQLPQEQALH